MKFKTKVINAFALTKLLQVLQPLNKSKCHIKLSSLDTIAICQTEGSMKIWSYLHKSFYFANFLIQSKNNNNEIVIEVDIKLLLKALHSSATSSNVTMKLTKKNNLPYLSFDLTLADQSLQHDLVQIQQDVPIKLVGAETMASLVEPFVADPIVSIFLPTLKELKTMAERVKSMSDYLTISATMAHSMTIRVDTNLVIMSTFYKNLKHPVKASGSSISSSQSGGSFRPDPNTRAEAKIDSKNFLKFLNCHQLMGVEVVCGIGTERDPIVFYVKPTNKDEESFNICYYMPAVAP